MTPGARVAAAIEILDRIGAGQAAEQALTRWARRSRFAGSKDRAAIRDHVFDVLRCRRSAQHYGRGTSGRAIMIGMLHQQGAPLQDLFSGEGHAPAPLSPAETKFPTPPTDTGVLWDLADWLVPHFKDSLGAEAEATALALRSRAPTFLRVNMARLDRASAQEELRHEGIETSINPRADAALTILEGARKLRISDAFLEGHVELQDASSQAVVACLPTAGKVLDYCAGGGGKALALAMDSDREVLAHDVAPARMADLPARTERAGARIAQIATDDIPVHAPFDVVLCDAPCSGSGAWRRAAEGKWTLDADRLQGLARTQDQILDATAPLVRKGGILAYATCSVLKVENEERVAAFLRRHPGWKMVHSHRFAVDAQGDGFFTAHLTHEAE